MNLKVNTNPIVKKNDAINAFIKEASKYKPLSMDEEKDLLVEYQTATKERKIEIRNTILKHNQMFIYSIAKRYAQDESIMDIISEGNLGFIEAFDTYDITKGTRFLTHAVWFIRRKINYYINNDALLLRKTNNGILNKKIDTIKNNFYLNEGRMPSGEEIKDLLFDLYGITVNSDDDIMNLKFQSISTSIEDEDDDNTFESSNVFNNKTSVMNEYEKVSDSEYNKEIVNRYMSVLDEREKQVICLLFGMSEFGQPLQFDEIGELLNVTGERVRQIKKSAMKKMSELANMIGA